MSSIPRISILTASKNGARFLNETLRSIQNQTFTDYEHIFVDAVSEDNTIDVLKEHQARGYNQLKWISEPDRHADEGFYKAMQMASGDYIMFCCVSDGYLDRNWFASCVEFLDQNPNISLVYGLPQLMTEDGSLTRVSFENFLEQPPPDREGFLPFWLGTYFTYPEINFCVRAGVYRECFPKFEETGSFFQNHALCAFNYHFNTKGYLPQFLPSIACYGRTHHDSNNKTLAPFNKTMNQQYRSAVDTYQRQLELKEINHVFRNGEGIPIAKLEGKHISDCMAKFRDFRTNRYAYTGRKDRHGLQKRLKQIRRLVQCFVKN